MQSISFTTADWTYRSTYVWKSGIFTSSYFTMHYGGLAVLDMNSRGLPLTATSLGNRSSELPWVQPPLCDLETGRLGSHMGPAFTLWFRDRPPWLSWAAFCSVPGCNVSPSQERRVLHDDITTVPASYSRLLWMMSLWCVHLWEVEMLDFVFVDWSLSCWELDCWGLKKVMLNVLSPSVASALQNVWLSGFYWLKYTGLGGLPLACVPTNHVQSCSLSLFLMFYLF